MSGCQRLSSEVPYPGWVATVAQKTGLDRSPGAPLWDFLGTSVIVLALAEPVISEATHLFFRLVPGPWL